MFTMAPERCFSITLIAALAKECALEVDVQHEIPVRFRHAEDQAIAGDASVVDEHIQATPALDRLSDHLLGILKLCDVRLDEDRLSTLLADHLDGFLAAGGVHIADDEVGALTREEKGYRSADAATATGNEHDLIFEAHSCHPSRTP